MYLHKVCLCWSHVFVKCQNAVCYAERMRRTIHFLHNWVWMTDNQWSGFKKAQIGAASCMSFSQLPSRGRERNVLPLRFLRHTVTLWVTSGKGSSNSDWLCLYVCTLDCLISKPHDKPLLPRAHQWRCEDIEIKYSLC